MTASPPSHIVILSLENQDSDDIEGSSSAPYLNQLIAEGMLFTNYDALTHPSQPNYLALFSGSMQGVDDDTVPANLAAPSMAGALAAKGFTFEGYAQDGSDPAHTPWDDFLDSQADALNFSAFPTTPSGFAALPTVSFVTPNNNDNMTDDVLTGDQWTQANLGAYAAWAQSNNSLLIVTFDEDDGDLPNQIATIVVGQGVPTGVQNAQAANQYALLETIENMYGLASIGETATAPVLDFASATPPTAASNFTNLPPGISDPNNYPPQNAIAVGANFVITAETTNVQWTNLTNNSVINDGLYSLLASAPNTANVKSLLDTRLAYDSATGQYVLIAVVYYTNANPEFDIDIATTTDPNGTWNVSTLVTGSNTTDLPGLTVDATNAYISSQVSGGTETFVVPLADVVNGATITTSSAGVQLGQNLGNGYVYSVAGASGQTYLISAFSNGAHTDLSYQTFNASTQAFSAIQSIAFLNNDVGSGGNEFVANQAGTAAQIDAGSGRIASLAYAKLGGRDYVYGVSEVLPTGATQPEFEWFQLDVTNATDGVTPPVFVQGGDISPASMGFSADIATYNPSIAVNAAGDVLINFTASGTSMDPADYYIVAGANQSFSAPTLYQASDAPMVQPLDGGLVRWGLNSSAVADPNNPNGFWISNEYVQTGLPNNFTEPAWWSTVTSHVLVEPAKPTVTITSASEASNQASQTIAGTVTSGGAGLVVGQTVTLTDNNVFLGSGVVLGDDTFSINVTLPNQGTNSIVASVVDSFGIAGTSAAVDDVLDSVAPTVTITSPVESSNNPNQTIAGTVTSGGAALVVGETVTLTDNNVFLGSGVVLGDDTFSINVVLPNSGINSIVASVADSFGNTGTSQALDDTLTSAGPTVTITSAPEASNQAGQTIAGTVTSGGAAAVIGQTVTLTDNNVFLGSGTVLGDDTFSVNVTLPNQGANSIVASVIDSLGATGTSAAVVDTLDSVSPTVAITSGSEASKQPSQTIAGTVSSGGAALVIGETVTLTDNNVFLVSGTVLGDDTFSIDVILPNQGTNKIVASVADSFGNAGTSLAVDDVLDSVAPTVAITSPAESSSNPNQTIAGTVTSGGAALVIGETVTLTDNNVFLASGTVLGDDTFSIDVVLPNSGINSIVASVADSFGNTGTSTAVDDTLTGGSPAWLNPVSGDFGTAADWTTAAVPGPADNATIAVAGTYTVSISSSVAVLAIQETNANATISIGASDTLTLSGASTLDGHVVGAGALALAGGGSTAINSPATISVANWSVQGAGTGATINENLNYSGAFSLGTGATLSAVGGYLNALGGSTIGTATLNGSKRLITQGTSTVAALTIGGTAQWQNSGTTTQSGGNVTVGDTAGNVATILNTSAGIYAISDDSGVGHGLSTSSNLNNQGLFEKTGGTATSTISAAFIDTGTVTSNSGTLAFNGPSSTFAGAITGTGTVAFSGGGVVLKSGASASVANLSESGLGTIVTLLENLGYGGNFTLGAGSSFNVSPGDALTLSAGTNSISGNIGGAGAFDLTGGTTSLQPGAGIFTANWNVSGAGTVLNSGNSLTYTQTFGLNSGATVTVAGGYMYLTGGATIANATVNGSDRFVVGGATSVSTLTIGGTVNWEIKGAVTQSGGNVTLGDGNAADVATMLTTSGGSYLISDDSGIGRGAATGSLITNQGLFEKSAGTGISTISASFNSTGTLAVLSGTLAFAGPSTSFVGAVNGVGAIAISGGSAAVKTGATVGVANLSESGSGTLLTLLENLTYSGVFSEGVGSILNIAAGDTLTLNGSGANTISGTVTNSGALDLGGGSTAIDTGAAFYVSTLAILGSGTTVTANTNVNYAGTFSEAAGDTFTLSGGYLALTGSDTFSGGTVNGSNRLVTRGTTSLSGLTIGGTAQWQNSGGVTENGGSATIGDATSGAASLLNTTTGTYAITDNSGIGIGTAATSSITNQGLLEKTAGTGTSVISPAVANTGTLLVSSGTLDFATGVTGTGSDTISGASTLEFDSSVAAGQTIGFTGAGGTLDIGSPSNFAGKISGFDTVGSADTIQVAGPWTYLGFTENLGGTQGTLAFANGLQTASITLNGDYNSLLFHPAPGAGSSTLITYG